MSYNSRAVQESSSGGMGLNMNGDSIARQASSAADALQKKHEAEANHHVLVEDVEDEEDLKHPPPSTSIMSAKALGKQRATEDSLADSNPVKQSDDRPDTRSHEVFPELGAGSQKRSQPPVATAWGAKKTSSSVNGTVETTHAPPNGRTPTVSTSASSRASTPASGPATPASTSGSTTAAPHSSSQRGPVPQMLSLPGKYSERITLYPQEMKPRSQLKKPVPDVLRDINRRSRAHVQVLSGSGGAVHFEATGPVEAVRQSLKDVAKELGSKQSTRVSVPSSVRPYIIGRQGTTIQRICERTGAQIKVLRPDDAAASGRARADEIDDDGVVEVLIEGDSVAAEMARREIEAIVNERTSTVNVRMKDIPVELYPFIAGPHNSRVAALEGDRDVRVHIPVQHAWSVAPPKLVSTHEPPVFGPASDHPIRVSGERAAVQAVCAEIERQVKQLRERTTVSQLDLNRGQHQFVIGEKGSSLHDFLAQTGCTVVLPPETHETETVTIVGPPENIEHGVNKVMDLASSMQMAHVDIARQHPNAVAGAAVHARNLTRYLQRRREIERLERLYDAHIAVPAADDPSTVWEIYSRDGKNNIRARSEIINIVNSHPPSRLGYVDANPFYHSHLADQTAQRLREELGVLLLVPEVHDPSSRLVLAFEGRTPAAGPFEIARRVPSQQEIRESEEALDQARRILESLVEAQLPITSRTMDVPRRFQDKVQRYSHRERQNVAPQAIPPQVFIGHDIPARDRSASSAHTTNGANVPVFLQGPAEAIDALAEMIEKFVEEETALEKERDHVTVFDFPQKYANYLIGRKGENIKKYREEFDVEIEVNDGKVTIKGPQVKADAAKARILALAKKHDDEATHVLKIKSQYHRDLIGAKGSQVKRLQDRYNVRIDFPRTTPTGSTADDRSVGGNGSEAAGAGSKRGRPAQAADEVMIRGPRKGAEEAKDELLSLLQWTIDHSHVATVSVARSQIPSLIGPGGREMESLRLSTGAQIDIPDKQSSSAGGDRAEIRIRGTKKEVEEAKRVLEQRAKVFDASVTRTLEVDKRHHKALIGSGGSNIRDMVLKAGGPDDRRDLARMVRFPRQDSGDTTIRVEGQHEVVDKIIAAMQQMIEQRENQTTEKIDVAPDKHRLLIGRGGETRRKLESQFGVVIDVPKQGASEESRSGVKVTGSPAAVEQAKEHILKLTKGSEGQTILVPRRLHHRVADNGNIFRRLRSDHKVTVDHAGQAAPRKADAPTPRARANGTALPLITDEGNGDEIFSWEVLGTNEAETDSGEIPWVLQGPKEQLAKARAMVDAAVQEASQQSCSGYLILPDPSTYRHVIGARGSRVNAIRQQTGCKITVPRDQARGEAIVILGSSAGVEEAKDMILEAVRNGGQEAEGRR